MKLKNERDVFLKALMEVRRYTIGDRAFRGNQSEEESNVRRICGCEEAVRKALQEIFGDQHP
jgi:hypothetical protein